MLNTNILKNSKKLIHLNNVKNKLIEAMGLLSHVVTDSIGMTDIDMNTDEYGSIISIMEGWRNKIELEEVRVLKEIEYAEQCACSGLHRARHKIGCLTKGLVAAPFGAAETKRSAEAIMFYVKRILKENDDGKERISQRFSTHEDALKEKNIADAMLGTMFCHEIVYNKSAEQIVQADVKDAG